MTRQLVITSLCCAFALQASAQSEARQSFQEFRKNMHRDFQDFRSRILEQYADFLEGEWHAYEPLMMPERDKTPKPAEAPVIQPAPTAPVTVNIPTPEIRPVVTPSDIPSTTLPATPGSKTPRPKPGSPASRHSNEAATDDFSFYGIPVSLQRVQFNIMNDVRKAEDTPVQWRVLSKSDAPQAARLLADAASEMGLNGYLTFRLAYAYVAAKFPGANDPSRMSATHFLMSHMGYDVRLAMTGRGIPLMLIPFDCTVYGSLYLPIDGRTYTVFTAEGVDSQSLNGDNIHTCQLPAGGDKGKVSGLKLNGLNLPYKPYHFNLSGGDLHLTGELNENMMAMLYHYPQMPTEDFASSVLDQKLRDSLVNQVRQQLNGLDAEEAVNRLMAFFHQGLPYATDEQRHGFEKPYFLEETLYYDRCDCEDRAIMFTYLLWNALGVKNHLIAYPGHESAAVEMKTPTNGHSYTWQGSRYFSADPTYIGAKVGDIMPQYTTTTPTIDKSYH